MCSSGFQDLRSAARYAFAEAGAELLQRPKELTSFLIDLIDLDGVEMRVLMRSCDEELLAPLAELGADADSDAVAAIRERVAAYLRTIRVVDAKAAKRTSRGVVAGYVDWKGFSANTSGSVGGWDAGSAGAGTTGTLFPSADCPVVVLVGKERQRGKIDGVAYKLDSKRMYAKGASSIVRLHSQRCSHSVDKDLSGDRVQITGQWTLNLLQRLPKRYAPCGCGVSQRKEEREGRKCAAIIAVSQTGLERAFAQNVVPALPWATSGRCVHRQSLASVVELSIGRAPSIAAAAALLLMASQTAGRQKGEGPRLP